MTLWDCRIGLARLGFHTQLRISTLGIRNENGRARSIGLWANTWYWQGWISEVNLQEHAIVDLDDEIAVRNGLLGVHERLLELCTRAHRDFPDEIPCQMADRLPDGRFPLAASTWAMTHVQGQTRDVWPTERLPEGLEVSSLPDDPVLEALVKVAPLDIDFEDRLDTYHGRNRFRQIRDCTDREWTHVLRPTVRKHHDTKIMFHPVEFTSPLLDPRSAANMIGSTVETLIRSFDDHAPGGILSGTTRNGLPPGFMTRAEAIAADKTRRDTIEEDIEP